MLLLLLFLTRKVGLGPGLSIVTTNKGPKGPYIKNLRVISHTNMQV